MSTLTRIRIFVSGPSDVQPFKRIVSNVAASLNREWGDHLKTHLDVVAWETDVHSAAGPDAQSVVNEQIPEHEVFLGLMWRRFGAPTPRAGSGTEEEFNVAYERFKQEGKPEIRFYFCKDASGLDLLRMDLDQILKVQTFRTRLEQSKPVVVYTEFADGVDLESRLRFDLSRLLQKVPSAPQEQLPPGLTEKFQQALRDSAKGMREASAAMQVVHEHTQRSAKAWDPGMSAMDFNDDAVLLSRETNEAALAVRTKFMPALAMYSAMDAAASHFPPSQIPPELARVFEKAAASVVMLKSFSKTCETVSAMMGEVAGDPKTNPATVPAILALTGAFRNLGAALSAALSAAERINLSMGPTSSYGRG